MILLRTPTSAPLVRTRNGDGVSLVVGIARVFRDGHAARVVAVDAVCRR